MTEEKLAEYLKERGFRVESKQGRIVVLLEKSDLIRFGFPMSDFGDHGEGLANAASAFAEALNGNLIYSVIVHALTGMSPSEVSGLPDENFGDIVSQGALTEARALTDEAMKDANRLAKTARDLAAALREGVAC